MNFDLSEDQAMLKDTVERLFAASADPEDLWASMAETGLLAAPFAEEAGGLGLGPVETLVIAEAAGRALAVSPYASAVAAAGTALRLAPAPPLDRIAVLASGEARFAWGHDEAGRDGAAPRGMTAISKTGGWGLSGTKIHVGHVTDQTVLVLTVTVDGRAGVLIVPAQSAGLSIRSYRLFDGSPAAEIILADVAIGAEGLLAQGADAETLIERTRDHIVAYRVAEAVGLMQAMLDATLDHLKTRRQFGQTLSAFQALRHKAADMLIALEQARSMAMFAALSVEDADADARRKAIRQVRSVVAKSSRLVAQTAVQLHGGIGVTEEHPVGRAFRKLTLIDLELERG